MKRKLAAAALALLLAVLASRTAAAAETDSVATDLHVLEAEYVMKSASFAPGRRKQALEQVAALKAQPPTDKLELFLAVSRIAALADNAHDSVMRGKDAWQPQARLPLRLLWFQDALIVARAPAEHSDILGSEILTMDGRSPAELMRKLRSIQGGPDEYRRWQMAWALTTPEVLHALGIAKSPSSVTLRVKSRNGRIISKAVAAASAKELPPGVRQGSFWFAEPLKGEAEAEWAAATRSEVAPLYLQEPNELFRAVEVPDVAALYVQFRTNMDEGEHRIEPFVQQLSERLRTAPPQNFILDLRFDTGGDSTKTRHLMREIAARVPGRIYTLVGPYTFSAGIASAAAVKHDGGDKVVIIGSEMGDRMRWWSEGSSVCLPSSGLCVRRTDGYWDINKSCIKQAGCYSDQFDLTVASLRPDVEAPVTSADWVKGVDPALEAVRKDLRSGRARLAARAP